MCLFETNFKAPSLPAGGMPSSGNCPGRSSALPPLRRPTRTRCSAARSAAASWRRTTPPRSLRVTCFSPAIIVLMLVNYCLFLSSCSPYVCLSFPMLIIIIMLVLILILILACACPWLSILVLILILMVNQAYPCLAMLAHACHCS